MPVKKGCSVESCKRTYEELLKSGRTKEQAFAITINTARKYSKQCSFSRRRKIAQGKLFEG
jgi:hypothetical protein